MGRFRSMAASAIRGLASGAKPIGRRGEGLTPFGLMMNAFNETGSNIRLTDLQTTSQKDEQKGFRYVFAGTMSGIRNPRGHDNRVDPIPYRLKSAAAQWIKLANLSLPFGVRSAISSRVNWNSAARCSSALEFRNGPLSA